MNETILVVITWILAISAIAPMSIVIIEVFSALTWRKRPLQVASATDHVLKATVLIPAHNEEQGISRTLDTVFSALPDAFKVVCIAHNCSDGTAQVARQKGATVVEASDDGSGGKPAALKAGLSALDDDPPDVVVVIDADCIVEHGTIETLAREAYRRNCPVMASYLFEPAGDEQKSSLSSLAILLKNFIRPLGLHVLGLPCLLNGSGSAYPFAAIRHAPHGEGSIAEDYQLAIDLLRQGYPTRFLPEAKVIGRLPTREATALKQRRRWEHGQLWLAFRAAPKLVWEGLSRGDLDRLAIGLEVSVPPLAFLLLMFLIAVAVSTLAYPLHNDPTPVIALLAVGGLFFLTIVLGWIRFAGFRDSVAAVLALPRYILWKLPMYRDYFHKRETRWVKTARD
jgi:cellulose synthase/poly-beta-1,6-N-acetylglucosamine synthase-like glycosyltransferase